MQEIDRLIGARDGVCAIDKRPALFGGGLLGIDQRNDVFELLEHPIK